MMCRHGRQACEHCTMNMLRRKQRSATQRKCGTASWLTVKMTRNPHTPPRRLDAHEPVIEMGATIRGATLDLPLRGSRPKML
eukprot:12322274-Heterocapsa_arctica.AAC.1